MNQLQRFLYLPSGGLAYDPIIRFSPLTNEYVLFSSMPAHSNSFFEQVVQMIERYATLPVPTTQLLLSDFYFLYAQFYTIDLSGLDDKYFVRNQCHCGHENKILIAFSDVKTNQFSKFSNSLTTEKTILVTDMNVKITFRRRIVQDNIDFGYLNLYSDGEVFTIYKNYIASQIKTVLYNEQIVEPKEYMALLNEMNNAQISEIYTALLNFDNEIGIDNNIQYKCGKCGSVNTTQIFNNMQWATIRPFEDSTEDVKKIYRNYLSIARLPCFGSLSEVLNLPLICQDNISEIIQKMKFTPLM